jgi:hypothetical protein
MPALRGAWSGVHFPVRDEIDVQSRRLHGIARPRLRVPLKLGGVVVGCRAIQGGRFEVTVLFVSGDEACAAEFRHLLN